MMRLYAKLNHWYKTALIRSIRLLVCVLLVFLIMLLYSRELPLKIPLFLFNIFLMIEMFFHYKIGHAMPEVVLEKNDKKDIFRSFTLQAISGFVTETKTSEIIRKLSKLPQIKVILQKANISHAELVFIDLPQDVVAESAFDTAKTFKAKYIATIDVFIAYLLLTEKDTKLLFAKQLKIDDLYNILYWTKLEYPEEENPKKVRVRMEGAGVGEALVSGWTPETRKYTANFTSFATRQEPLIRGRENEFKLLLEALIKIEGNNVLLVGDIGAGKENLVKALAYHSFEGNLGGYLNHKRVFQILVGALTAGAGNRSDLEERLQNIIAEVSHAQDVILFIPEFQNILGATSYNLDLSGALLPYLKSGNIPVIATMTTGEYKTYMEKNPLREAFTVIPLKEPDENIAIQMVMGEAAKVENKYHVILSYRAIASAVELAGRFLQDQALPGSAVALLEAVSNSVTLDKKQPFYEKTKRKIVLEEYVVKKVEEATHVPIGMPTGEEINLLLHLEDKMHEKVVGQEDAVSAIAEAMRRVRSGMSTSERPISFLFLGPTGVGKTETAKTLANLYYGGEKNMIRLDMSEYTDETGVRRLLGAPPGEGQERGELTDKIHDNPASLVLLDEFEKAHPKIHDLFLQVLDDGRLTDNKGQTVSFRNAIIIATSNAGSEFIREEVEKGTKIDKIFQKKLLDHLQTKGVFKPEFLNRFDDVITFKPLGEEQVIKVVKLLLDDIAKTLSKQDIKVSFNDAVIEKICKEGFDAEFGARPLRRYIQDTVEDMISQKKLTKEIDRGKSVTFAIDGTGALALTIA